MTAQNQGTASETRKVECNCGYTYGANRRRHDADCAIYPPAPAPEAAPIPKPEVAKVEAA